MSEQADEEEEIYHTETEELGNERESQKSRIVVVNPNTNIPEDRANRQMDEPQVERNGTRLFSIEEVGDLIKSRRNLVYMFRFSGIFIRFLLATRQDVFIEVFEGRPGEA